MICICGHLDNEHYAYAYDTDHTECRICTCRAFEAPMEEYRDPKEDQCPDCSKMIGSLPGDCKCTVDDL